MPRRIPLPTWLWLRPLTWLAMLGAVLLFPWTHASAAPLLLGDDRATVNAWPAATLLSDPSLQLSVHDVLARTDQFVPPPSVGATLGMRSDAVWLRIPFTVAKDVLNNSNS